MFDVLVYLFENYIQAEDAPSQDDLERELAAAGFSEGDILRALDWLKDLDIQPDADDALHTSTGFRHFCEQELRKIEGEGLSFLLFVEQAGIIVAAEREWVLDRLMALSEPEVSADQVKWIVLMILWKQGRTEEYLLLEDILYEDERNYLH